MWLSRCAIHTCSIDWLSFCHVPLSAGVLWEHTRGIPLACSLSPLLGGFYLYRLDVALTRPDVFYLRYMDDVRVLTPTRHKLRQAVRVVNQLFEALELHQHLDKTYIGPIERGFTFLGRHYPAQ
ncbi:reverse transcriptase domain-containing protein [Pseudomonas sp. MDT2-39-1]